MESSKTLYQFNRDDHFLAQLKQMRESLTELGVIMDRQQKMRPMMEPRIIYRPVAYRPTPPGKKHKPVLVFPFNLLAASIDRLLKQLERFALWLTRKVVIRVLARLKQFLNPSKRSK